MVERIKVLRHHKKTVEKNWIGITDLSEARRCIEKFILDECDCDLADGTLMYPNMDVEGFIDSYSRIIVAVNKGEIEEMPEKKEGGLFNFDAVCESCGNLISHEKIEPGETNCNLFNRVSILSARLH